MNDLRVALRSLRKSPGFTSVAVLTLALGIGANTAIFSVVNGVMLRPLPFPHPEGLAVVSEVNRDGSRSNTSFATYRDLAEQSKTMASVVAVRDWQPTLNGVGEATRLPGMRVAAGFFRMLGAAPALGRDFTEADDHPDTWHVALLSHGLWQQRFGGRPDIVGRTITLGGVSFTVIGVMPRDFSPVVSGMFYRPAQIWAPMGYSMAQPWSCRDCRHIKALARVRDDLSVAQARTELDAISRRLVAQHPDEYPWAGMLVTPFSDYIAGPVKAPMLALLAAVGFLLLMACAKVANLSLARAIERQRELAVRGALGAGRWRLARRLLVESLLIGVMGGAAGLMVAIWGTSGLLVLAPAGAIPRMEDVHMDARVLLFTLGTSLVTALAFGMVPALRGSRLDLNSALKDGSRVSGGRARSRFRGGLVVANLAIALVLLAGAGLALKSFARLARVDPGFDPRNLLTMQLTTSGARYTEQPAVLQFYHQVTDDVRGLPGVQGVALASQIPLGGNRDQFGITIEGRPWDNPAAAPYAERYEVSPAYFRTLGIPVRSGRVFGEQDGPATPPVAVINQAFARALFPGEDAIGKRILLGGGPEAPWRTIVGVVGDVHHESLEQAPDFQAYVPFDQTADADPLLLIRSATDPAPLAAPAKRAVWALDRDQPVSSVATMEQLLASTLAQRQFTMTLLAAFAALALLLAVVGIYSVMAYSVVQRTHEFGVRVALGALRGDVVGAVVREGGALIALGLLLGLAGAGAVARGVRGLLYDVSPTDPVVLGLVTALLAGAGLLACLLPARRATRIDPMEALRCE
jgi:putative ABC transport system permease protein